MAIGPSSKGKTPVFGTGDGGSNPPGPIHIREGVLMSERITARLLQLGVLQLALGSLGGGLIGVSESPSLALSIHLGVLLNGATMIGLGLMWHRLTFGPRLERAAFWLLGYGAIGPVAALLGVGGSTFTQAGAGAIGTPGQEMVMKYAMLSMVTALGVGVMLVCWGARHLHEGTPEL